MLVASCFGSPLISVDRIRKGNKVAYPVEVALASCQTVRRLRRCFGRVAAMLAGPQTPLDSAPTDLS